MIAIQDFWERKVFVAFLLLPFPLGLALSFAELKPLSLSNPDILNLIVNVLITAVLVISLSVYIRIFKKGASLNGFFGKADILLLFGITSVFDYNTFLKVLIGASLLGILESLVAGLFGKETASHKVAFASWLSVVSILFIFLR